MKPGITLAVFAICLTCFASDADGQSKAIDDFLDEVTETDLARFRERWTLKQLTRESDLIIVFTCFQDWQADPEAKVPEELDEHKENLRIVCCRLQPTSILKSTNVISDDNSVSLQMVVWKSEPGFSSGPILVDWLRPDRIPKRGQPDTQERLIVGFFKKNQNSAMYEPVAAHVSAVTPANGKEATALSASHVVRQQVAWL